MKPCTKCGASSSNLAVNFDSSVSCRKCGNLDYRASGLNRKLDRHNCCEGKRQLCGRCQSKMRDWKEGGKRGPAPFVAVLGVWVKNGG